MVTRCESTEDASATWQAHRDERIVVVGRVVDLAATADDDSLGSDMVDAGCAVDKLLVVAVRLCGEQAFLVSEDRTIADMRIPYSPLDPVKRWLEVYGSLEDLSSSAVDHSDWADESGAAASRPFALVVHHHPARADEERMLAGGGDGGLVAGRRVT
jgi:hypothetical protein